MCFKNSNSAKNNKMKINQPFSFHLLPQITTVSYYQASFILLQLYTHT